MSQEMYSLDAARRKVVCEAIIEECEFRGWAVHALHVRSWHVHLVVTAERDPEFLMRACKANASKRLNRAGFENTERKRWTAHGSTKYLWNEQAIAETVDYTLNRQGEVMAIYPFPGLSARRARELKEVEQCPSLALRLGNPGLEISFEDLP